MFGTISRLIAWLVNGAKPAETSVPKVYLFLDGAVLFPRLGALPEALMLTREQAETLRERIDLALDEFDRMNPQTPPGAAEPQS